MTALDDIEAAAGALNALTAQEAAEKARIDAAVAAALTATVAVGKTVYLDAVAGLDTNDGLTLQTAVKTLGAAAVLFSAGQYGNVALLSDVVLGQRLNLPGPYFGLSSYGVNAAGQAGTIRTLTIPPGAASLDANGFKAAIVMTARGTLGINNLNLSIGAHTADTAGVIDAEGFLYIGRSAITFDPALAAPLFATPNTATTFDIAAATLPASYPGKLFGGVSAGVNPNANFRIRTNVTSA